MIGSSSPSTGNPSFDLQTTNQQARSLRGILVISLLVAILFIQVRIGLVVDVDFWTSLRDGSWPTPAYLIIGGFEVSGTALLLYLLVLVLLPPPTRLEVDRNGLTLLYPANRSRAIPWSEFPVRWTMIRFTGGGSRAPSIRSFLNRGYWRLIYVPDEAPLAIARLLSSLGYHVRIEPFKARRDDEGPGEKIVVTANRL